MNDCFEYYTLRLVTLAPTFVGSGKKIGKKEFCFTESDDSISFIDMNKLIDYMVERDEADGKNRAGKFEKFMLPNGRNYTAETLNDFLDCIRMPQCDRDDITIYSVQNNGCFDNDHTHCEVHCFMRNGKNKAYIPGSSIKGMIRTMLLQYLISQNRYKPHCFETDRNGKKKSMSKILAEEADNAEQELINTLPLIKTKNGSVNVKNAVNSIMRGVIVSDSEFIDDSNFIICRKYDVYVNGRYYDNNKINIARECLKQGVEVEFKIKIDRRYFKPTGLSGSFEKIFGDMTAEFSRQYRELYLSRFSVLPDGSKKHFNEPFVILGGGSGYFGKNITYSLNGYRRGLEKTSDYMTSKKIKGKRVNPNDLSLGISPHMLKEVQLGNTCCHLGLCRAEIERDPL